MQPDFNALRVKMVDGQLRTTDVTNHELLSAFLSVPRELFVSEQHRDLAYLDDDIQIAKGRFLMEPSPLAKLLQLAAIQPDDNVLIVGSGTGYSAAIVSALASEVIALDCEESLVEQSKANLATLNVTNVDHVCGPLNAGASLKGPFEVILIEGSVSQIPEAIIDQLANGGRLVTVEGQGLTGVAKSYIKAGHSMASTHGFNLAVKSLPGFEVVPVFSL